MKNDDWERVLSEAAKLACTRVQFIGGEPTLHPHLPQLIALARELGFDFVEVYTNGTHLTKTLKAVFVEHRVALAFSLYAMTAEIHDRVTLRSGSFSKTLNSIKWANGVGLPLRVSVIDVGVNAAAIEETVRALKQLGIHCAVDRQRGVGRAASAVKSEMPLGELCGRCWEGKLCVTPSGVAHPCVFSRFCAVGDARSGLATLVGAEHLQTFRKTARDFASTIGREANCNPQCGPDCSPAQCAPQQNCGPLTCRPASVALRNDH
jgi:MoaA/NifB/PqqE/SkfB family radical SAM enzyme